ncbi:YbcC family protein [Pseudoduganella ginsengisoli]
MLVERACAEACSAIAPAWPLDRAIAVNPHWARIGMPLRRVAARMAVLGSIGVLPPREQQQQAYDAGRITLADVDFALRHVPGAQTRDLTARQCLDALAVQPGVQQLPLLIDVLDNDPQRHTRLSWRQAITHQVSQTCAAYFDHHQADWQPARTQGLYAFWRDTLRHDHGIGMLMGLPDIGRAIDALPATARDAEQWVMARLGLPPAVWADYLEAVLLTVNGWASWCAYLGWQARLEGRTDPHLRDLLAIRLAWGALLLECKDDLAARQAYAALRHAWDQAPAILQAAEHALLVDEVWQVALEAGYQRTLAQRLLAPPAATRVATHVATHVIEVQAAFCIDVRSEPLRRALEAAWPAVQTVGCAGFFGLPAAYTPLGTPARRPQLPGLLAPAIDITDCVAPAADAGLQQAAGRARQARLAMKAQWHGASRWPGAAFSYVEAAGLGYLAKLGNWILPRRRGRARDDLEGMPRRYRALCQPQLTGLETGAQVDLAYRILHAMGLAHGLAPLVLLVGHGSQSANNAHAAALDCGACCGQSGDVNARTLARLLNHPAVRSGLHARGIAIPDATVFMAALHNTTTDEVEVFDEDVAELLRPHAAQGRWRQLQDALAQAGSQVRRERAPRLGLDPAAPHDALLAQLRRRANDGAQTRPEWGLAGNAAFIIAPRLRSQAANLEGRAFLHDYDARHDADGSVLETLMTAPMVVAHWINWQYHASTCDPARLGSGNKLLHNVVGGNLGVFEGNGGDLRIGLSRQSLHDGSRWVHEPLRLTVVIDAPQAAIDAVIGKHDTVRHLLDHGWLHLWRYTAGGLARHERGQWRPFTADSGLPP